MFQFYWNWFSTAFDGAWAISSSFAGGVAIIMGIIVWRVPHWESPMKNLAWMIPLGIFLILLIIRLAIAPYDISQQQQTTISQLRNELEVSISQKLSTPEDLRRETITGRDILISELARDSNKIRNKHFYDCKFIGEAVIQFQNVYIEGSNKFIGPDINSIFIVATNPKGSAITGVITFQNWRKCKKVFNNPIEYGLTKA